MNKVTIWMTFLYGIAIAAGGYMGYKAGSPSSLYTGVPLGLCLIFSGVLMLLHQKFAIYATLGLTILLTSLFSYRYALTGKGICASLAVFSGGMLFFFLLQCTKWKKK